MGALDASSEGDSVPNHAHHHDGATTSTNAHHQAGGPIPSPMNPNEVWLGLNASYDATRALRLNLGATGALPTSDDGETRATLRGGVEFPFGALTPGLGFEVDVLGVTRREVALASFALSF